MQYQVVGASRDSGKAVTLIIDADTGPLDGQEANRLGVMVQSIQPHQAQRIESSQETTAIPAQVYEEIRRARRLAVRAIVAAVVVVVFQVIMFFLMVLSNAAAMEASSELSAQAGREAAESVLSHLHERIIELESRPRSR